MVAVRHPLCIAGTYSLLTVCVSAAKTNPASNCLAQHINFSNFPVGKKSNKQVSQVALRANMLDHKAHRQQTVCPIIARQIDECIDVLLEYAAYAGARE